VKIQTKLLIPLAVLVLVLFFYVEFLWLPQLVRTVKQENVKSVEAHMSSVVTGLVPLLLTNQLANIYDNLDTVKEQNPHWLSISLYDNKKNLLYPLFESNGNYSSSSIITLSKNVIYLDNQLGRMELIVDLTSQIQDISLLEQKVLLVFMISMIFFIVAALLILNLVVHFPLTKLIMASNEIAKGNYDTELPRYSRDEVGSLVSSFKTMRNAIQKSQEALKREVKSHKFTADALYKEKERVTYHASHDALTGLVNRREFEIRAKDLLKLASKDHSQHALLYIDLDQFKIVNDTCGHVAGDSLLRQLGTLLGHKVREGDILARLGGDEFGVLLERCPIEKAITIANDLRDAVSDFHFHWEDNVFTIGASIGLVAITRESQDIETLLSTADTACYAAKDKGRNRVHVYEPDDQELAKKHGEMRWVAKINMALDENNFVLYNQPIVGVKKGRNNILYTELLIRMIGDNNKLIPPGAFLAAAERYGLMEKIDKWVVEHAFSFISREIKKSPGKFSDCYGINLSGSSVGDMEFLDFIIELCKKYNMPKGVICFEITESTAISELNSAIRFISELKKFGCKFALDDFGRGLSSFAYLKNLPVDYLKIDGVFVKDIHHDPIDLAMVKSINEIGHLMGMKTIAEFVEEKEIYDLLNEIGVDFAQGIWVAKPYELGKDENMESA